MAASSRHDGPYWIFASCHVLVIHTEDGQEEELVQDRARPVPETENEDAEEEDEEENEEEEGEADLADSSHQLGGKWGGQGQAMQQDTPGFSIKAPQFVPSSLASLILMDRLSAASVLCCQQGHLPDSSSDVAQSILKQHISTLVCIDNTNQICYQLRALFQYASRARGPMGDFGLPVPKPDYVTLPNVLTPRQHLARNGRPVRSPVARFCRCDHGSTGRISSRSLPITFQTG